VTGFPEGIVSDHQGRIYVGFYDRLGRYWTCYRTSRPGISGSAAVQRPVLGYRALVVRTLPRGIVVFDAMGRRVANPRSGIYFIREQSAVGGKPSTVAVRKVVVQR
jgi:hypothetical protein